MSHWSVCHHDERVAAGWTAPAVEMAEGAAENGLAEMDYVQTDCDCG